jgi:hypothetical protein
MKDLRIDRLGHLVKKPLKRRKVRSYTRKIKRRRLVGGNFLVALGSAALPAISAAVSAALPAIAAGATNLFSLIIATSSAATTTGTAAGTGAIIGTAGTGAVVGTAGTGAVVGTVGTGVVATGTGAVVGTAGTGVVATGVTASSIAATLGGFAIGALQTAGTVIAGAKNPYAARRIFEALRNLSMPSPSSSSVAREATLEALIREPIPTGGKLSLDYLNDLLQEGATDTPTLISGFFKAPENGLKINVPEKVKSDLLMKAVRSPDKIIAQRKAFIETLIYNNRIEGSPAEILEFAGKFIGNEAAVKALEPITNPTAALRAKAEANVGANIAGIRGPNREQQISDYIRKGLEKSYMDEAKLLVDAERRADKTLQIIPSNQNRLEVVFSTFMKSYRSVFGGPPTELDVLQRFVPNASNIRHVLATGVTNVGVAKYSLWLSNARQHFIGQMSEQGRINFTRNINENTLPLIRQGMLRVFYHDEALAAEVLDNFASIIVPRMEAGDIVQLEPFLASLRSNPAGAREAMDTLINSITNQAAREAAAIALSRARSLATLPVRLMTRLAQGVLTGAVGLFAVMLQGTPNGGGLAEAGGLKQGVIELARNAQDRVYEWFGIQIQQNPPTGTWAETLAGAGGFKTVEEWQNWMASQARGWLWRNLFAILTTIGGAIATAYAFLMKERPEDGRPLTRQEINQLETPPTNGGRRVKRRRTKKNR